MKPPADELDRRRPVWEAMAAFFLDTEVDEPWREQIVDVLVASGYTDQELERILWDELCPVLYTNLLSPAGEWDGFDMAMVEHEILSRPAGRLRRWWACFNVGRAVRQHDWEPVQRALAARRSGRPV